MLIINGKVYEPGAPEATLLNRSFKYGDGLFESIRVFEGRPLFWNHHYQRLEKGMEALKFEFDPEEWKATLEQAIETAIRENDIENHGRLRLHVYRSGTGAFLPLDRTPYYLLEAYALKTDYFRSNHTVSLVDFHEIPLSKGYFSGFKTANSLPYIVGAMYARDKGFDDALMYDGPHVAETTSANIFMVRKHKIFTPPLDSGCLDGIMRKQVLTICRNIKVECMEKPLKPKQLQKADEIFVTNSIRGIVPVHAYGSLTFDNGGGAMTSFLQKCLLEFVEGQ